MLFDFTNIKNWERMYYQEKEWTWDRAESNQKGETLPMLNKKS